MMQPALIASIVLALAYLGAITLATLLLAVKRGGRRERLAEDRDSIAGSRFTIPVSVIVPLAGDVPASAAAPPEGFVAALLALQYPEFEVVVVVDQDHGWLDALKAEWKLEAHEFFYRKALATADVRRIYRSPRDARLLVIEKQSGGRADAVNCGVNVARYRYVTTIDSGIRFDADALLRAMSGALRDPAAAVGASSRLERVSRSQALRLATIRSWMLSTMAADRSVAAPVAPDAVTVWRRDAILQFGGFSPAAADADFDMTVRVESSGQRGMVVHSAEIFGTCDPLPGDGLTRLAARRQLAALQAVGRLLTAGAVGRKRLVSVLAGEVITPFAQVWALVAALGAAGAGWLPWRDGILVVALLCFGRAITSSAALLMRGAAAGSPDRSSLAGLLLFAPLDFVVTTPAGIVGRARGSWSFIKQL
jgi:glycosyltransferase involved in cell wall biosynthesis